MTFCHIINLDMQTGNKLVVMNPVNIPKLVGGNNNLLYQR